MLSRFNIHCFGLLLQVVIMTSFCSTIIHLTISLGWTCRLFLIICYHNVAKNMAACVPSYTSCMCKCICMINTYKWDYGVKDVCPRLPRTPVFRVHQISENWNSHWHDPQVWHTVCWMCEWKNHSPCSDTGEAFMAAARAPNPKAVPLFVLLLMDFPYGTASQIREEDPETGNSFSPSSCTLQLWQFEGLEISQWVCDYKLIT